MYRGSGPRIFPIIVVILVIALVIAALVSVGRMIFSGGSSSESSNSESTASVVSALQNINDSRGVRWTVRGPIVADEDFRSYQITVTPTERKFVTYAGYLDQIVDVKSYSNNTEAYEQFVYALDKANAGTAREASDEDFRGVCATQGFAYKFETLSDELPDHMLWTTTCKGSKGTLAANTTQVHALFVNQIPDFKPVFTQID